MRKRGRREEKMGRAPCCNKGEVKKGAWTPEEDKILVDYITKNGHGTWRSFPKLAGLQRCGKSCRLRWTNYLRPDIKRGAFSFEEEQTIYQLHSLHGNKWAAIASRLSGRTDNEIKNYWNSHLRKRLPTKIHTLQTKTDTSTIETTQLMDPMLPAITDSNSFLHEWSSAGAGEAFEKTNFNEPAFVIPTPQASSMVKIESDSIVTMQEVPGFAFTSTSESCDHMSFKIEANASDSQSSYETENSSDLTLDLLLDFPIDGDYLEYV